MKRLINRILSYLGFTKWHLKPNHEVKLAFVHKGVEYYCMTSGVDTYAQRYFAALDIFEAMGYKVDAQFMDTFQDLLDDCLNKGLLSEASRLNGKLRERRKQLLNEELILSLASIWFFDKSENVYTYNHHYAAEKINRWRGDGELMQNFYETPLAEYMPSNNTLKENMQRYLLGASHEELMILESHLRRLLKEGGPKDLISNMQLRVEQLRKVV
jgi:hypothetical protein